MLKHTEFSKKSKITELQRIADSSVEKTSSAHPKHSEKRNFAKVVIFFIFQSHQNSHLLTR